MVNKFGMVSAEDYVKTIQNFATDLLGDKFYGNKCKACDRKYFPPRMGCECYSTDMEAFEMPTEATLKAYTVIHFAPDSMSDKAPYIAVIGEFENGLRVLAHLVGVMSKPKVGMKMKLKIQKIGDDRVTYKYGPA